MQASDKRKKNALVTGAGRRIGRAIALHLAAQGWGVAIHCRRSVADAEALAAHIRQDGGRAEVLQADLTQEAELDALVARAEAALGPITGLINNAAVFERETLGELSQARFMRHMLTNLYAPLALSRDLSRRLPAGSEGWIIHLADGMREWSLSPNYVSYALSKLGLLEATRLLAQELAPRCRIHALALGATLPGEADQPGFFARLGKATPEAWHRALAEICQVIDFIISQEPVTGEVFDLHLPSAT